MPVFIVTTMVIILAGHFSISRITPTFYSSAELQITSDFLAGANIGNDEKTQYEYLNYRVQTASGMQALTRKWGTLENVVQINLQAATHKIIIGAQHETAVWSREIAQAIQALFVTTANQMRQQNLTKKINLLVAEVETLRSDLRSKTSTLADRLKGGSVIAQTDYQRTVTLLTAAMKRLAQAKSLTLVSQDDVLRIVKTPEVSLAPVGPKPRSMMIALIAFALFCAVVLILLLEWLDTVIRRPLDIERSLGLITFGVIPDLRPQPIKK